MIQLAITYDFPDQKEEDLAQLNAVLDRLPLSNLEIQDENGYREVTRDGNKNIIGLRYGLGSGKLICTPSTLDDSHLYRIDTYMFERPMNGGSEAFRDWWDARNPGRVIRTQITSDWKDGMQSIVVMSHERDV